MKKVSIITVHYNEPEMTHRLLQALAEACDESVECIVVDNGSRPEKSVRPLEQQFPQVRFVYSEKNLGFAGGNALALPHATGRYLFFLNNDALPAPGAISRLAAFLDSHPRAGAVSPLILAKAGSEGAAQVLFAGKTRVHPLTGRNRTLGRGATAWHQWSAPMPTAYVHGAAMMVRREVLETVGFMDAQYFLYYEELDWGERMRQAGWEMWVVPQARVWHDESHTVGTESPLKVFFLNRNRWRFMWRNRAGWQALAFAVWFFVVAVPMQAVRACYHGQRAHLAALRDAVRWVLGNAAFRQKIENQWKPA